MPEYIKRKALIEKLNEVPAYFDNGDIRYGIDIAIQQVIEQPTADVVEVVRCENCKHLTIHNSPTLYAYCEKTHYRFEPFKTDTRTHFCGFGELKEREGK